ncbi:MAG TPA: folylpolyglutamate synthase/dihydrofolate synthase family protein [Alphaproteobacteria bacterium]|nr:folylpolyglutamate synthase/dihydrofolate synthase family protein [Alphaproteobacteria bacterium]HNS44335.1 folylpolyglutamate synthase/dihydrofolate synthase family protein [Alphaproteobacteria bacterium]
MQPAHNSQATRVFPDQFDPDPRLQALIDRLTSYYPKAIDPELSRTFRLLHDLGNPHLKLPPLIHISGTNGKGSTLAYIRAIIESTGLTCHVMTSPHLVHLNERFVVVGKEMSNTDLLALFEEVETINADQGATAFEIMTAAGFLAFSRTPADATLVEVGMGGKFDATNVVPNPALTLIMSIAKDHTKFLGDKLTGIAAEKAGIIKPNAPCIIGPQSSEALAAGIMDIFMNTAEELDAPLYRYGHEWSFDLLPDGFILHTNANIFELPLPNLAGAHQIGNAATAAMGAHILENRFAKPLTLSAVKHGLTHAKWPGRLQKLTSGPLVDLVPSGWEIWIDGGHNDGCGFVLADQLKNWKEKDGKETHLVLGMLNTKDPKDFAKLLVPLAASTTTLTIPDQPLSLSGAELSDNLRPLVPDIKTVKNLKDAVTGIATTYEKAGRILITGSLYLMGAVLTDHR